MNCNYTSSCLSCLCQSWTRQASCFLSCTPCQGWFDAMHFWYLWVLMGFWHVPCFKHMKHLSSDHSSVVSAILKPCNPWWMYHCTKYKPKRRWGMQVAGDIVSIPVQQLPDSRKTFEDLYYPISSFFHLELFRFNWKLCSYGSKKKYCYCQQEVVTSIQLFA